MCLDILRSRTSRREESLDAQTFEPVAKRPGTDPEQEALLADSVGLALLVVLDRLSPAERLAFVLHDMFAVSFDEIGTIVGRSPSEGTPDAWPEVNSFATRGLDGLQVGSDIIVITWSRQARRDVMKVHPRSDPRRPLTGVFAARSPDRPNPLGLHRVIVRKVIKNRLRIGSIEAIDGTPVVDIKLEHLIAASIAS